MKDVKKLVEEDTPLGKRIKILKNSVGEKMLNIFLDTIKELEEEEKQSVNIDLFKSIKKVLNQSFGQERNQLYRPGLKSIFDLETDATISSFLNSYYITRPLVMAYLKKAIADTFFNKYYAIIHFPEIQIVNSKNQKHKIYDLYVRVCFSSDGKMNGNPKGLRATVTDGEIRVRYTHSHLSTVDYSGHIPFGNFCLGEGEINNVIAKLVQKYDETNFRIFCVLLSSYLSWESLEGGPFRNMADIGKSTPASTHNFYECLTSTNEVIAKVITDMMLEEVAENLITSVFTFTSDEEMNLSVRGMNWECKKLLGELIYNRKDAILSRVYLEASLDITNDITNAVNRGLLCEAYNGSEVCLRTLQNNQEEIHTKERLFTFKEKDITIKKIQNDKKNEKALKVTDIYARTRITDKVCECLTSRIQKNIAKNEDFINNYSSKGNEQAAKADIVPV